MGLTVAHKIIKQHLIKGEMNTGEEIAIKIDQTLTQDATGTMAYLEFESLGLDKVQTELSVSYVDHNTLQTDNKNMDDHRYLQSIARKYGIYFSRPGNGICHQVHLERFAAPGKTQLGSDSHTPTAGGIGALAIGVGGIDVVAAMGGYPFYLEMPEIIKIELKGKLNPFVTSKDIILKLLQILSVKGGVKKIFEYGGEGVSTLTVPERATITNMGAELGATTSIFPSDMQTRDFLKSQYRESDYTELKADPDAEYANVVTIDLNEIVPLAACPHSPDNVKTISELEGIKIDQVIIGSCTNSSYKDMMEVAEVLKDKVVHKDVSLSIAPGSRQVLNMLAENGALSTLIKAGARIIESACGPCIGMGLAPNTNAVSLRTFNRNFKGRCGTQSAGVYLVSPFTAAVGALRGTITDPSIIKEKININLPKEFIIDDRMIIPPDPNNTNTEIIRGPNIKPLPQTKSIQSDIKGSILLKVEDNITTDHIMPAGAQILPLRSNIPEISKFVFKAVDHEFYDNAMKEENGFIVGGENYGQGSSREHAALAPMYLGIKAVIVKSFARIHKANLINFGILPLTFVNASDYDNLQKGQTLELKNIIASAEKDGLITGILDGSQEVKFRLEATGRYWKLLKNGGLLNYIKENQ